MGSFRFSLASIGSALIVLVYCGFVMGDGCDGISESILVMSINTL